MTTIWKELRDAGIDTSRTRILPDEVTYEITPDDGQGRICFGGVDEGDEELGWTYTVYDEEDGVITTDGALTLEEILPELARWAKA